MFKKIMSHRVIEKAVWSFLSAALAISVTHSVNAAPAQDPLFLTAPVRPLMMLNMSRDHQLYYKIYDDYADITDPSGGEPDGLPDTTYNNNYDYYGYFDSKKCYLYSSTNKRFEPTTWRNESKACAGTTDWSGNFLNWATMTRMDVIRKILYGGYRSVDGADTVLERAYLPNDTHSFAKFYSSSNLTEMKNVVPDTYAVSTGVTFCNTTDPATRAASNLYSQNVTEPPLIKVAVGNHALWANNERFQCYWGTHPSFGQGNGNVSSVSGINASNNNPSIGGSNVNLVARVQVCKSGLIDADPALDNERCRIYSPGYVKPIGLLQEFGENNSIHFGFLTGSYLKNKSGGVLRKPVGSINDEINSTTGQFLSPTYSIINTLNKLRIFGYNYHNSLGLYSNASSPDWYSPPIESTDSDNCNWIGSNQNGQPRKRANFTDGRCTNWGNPQAEIYVESLRYLAGQSAATSAFSVTADKLGLTAQASWTDPVTATAQGNYCAPLNVLQFNASTVSYDADQLSTVAATISINDLADKTDAVASAEGILESQYFVGQINNVSNSTGYQLCTAKTITKLSDVRGTCPEAPRLEGSYQIAGLAYHARTIGLPTKSGQIPRQKVTTYGVSLAPAAPSIRVQRTNGRSFTIIPACRSLSTYSDVNTKLSGNCSLVDFKIVSQTTTGGKLYVSWEDQEQGGDFDQDMWGTITYEIDESTSKVKVTTDVFADSTGDQLAFGYVLSGTETDGFKAHSGIGKYTGESCNNCETSNSATFETYTLGDSDAKQLKDPLYYAAKWGGYSESLVKDLATTEAKVAAIAATEPSTYFFATDPRKLESSLRAAFSGVVGSVGSASAVSTSSTRLTTDSLVYQALFSSEDWSGELKILRLDSTSNALVPTDPLITTDSASKFDPADTRKIYTYRPDTQATVEFKWDNLAATQKTALQAGGVTEAVAQDRLNWIRGDRTKENAGGGMRIRKKLLGDIVNSSPVYSGNKNPRYSQLPGGVGTSYTAFTKSRIVYVGANDGMVHGFNADTLKEVFAYVPKSVYPKLANLTKPDYGMGVNRHQYLVDGALTVGDAYIGGAWRTILVGALGAGGRGVFALDVTNPASPSVIFDIDMTNHIALGHVMGEPAIVPMEDGTWSVVFENGYESGSTSQLFVINLEAPGTPKVIDTGGGTGLSPVALLPGVDGKVEYAYAGDLAGNVWKFNLSSANPTDWQLAYKLFTARDATSNVQPISGAPTLGLNPSKSNAVMIYFGTGKYFDDGDNDTPAAPRHSFYALADMGSAITYTQATRSTVLHQKSIATTSTATSRDIAGERKTNGASDVDWTSKMGWFIDFSTANGERVITKPLLVFDRLIFTTLIPSKLQCDYGGTGWLMELVGVGNKNISHSILDDLANSVLDSAVLGELSITTGPGENRLNIIPCDIKGDCDLVEGEAPAGNRGRMSWRQVR